MLTYFLVSMPSGIDSGHGTGSRGRDKVIARSTLCSRKKNKLDKDVLFSTHLADLVL